MIPATQAEEAAHQTECVLNELAVPACSKKHDHRMQGEVPSTSGTISKTDPKVLVSGGLVQAGLLELCHEPTISELIRGMITSECQEGTGNSKGDRALASDAAAGPGRCQPAQSKSRKKRDRQRLRAQRRREQALVESAEEGISETELRMWGCREGTSKNIRRGTPRPSPSPSEDGSEVTPTPTRVRFQLPSPAEHSGSDSAASSDTETSSVSSWQDMCEVCSLDMKRKGPPTQRMCPGCCGRVEVIYERQASKGTTFESFCDEWCDADAASRQRLVRHGLGMWQDLCISCQLYEGRANAPAPGVCIVCSNKMHGHYHRLKVQVVPFNQMCQIWSRAEANIRYKLLIRQGKTRS